MVVWKNNLTLQKSRSGLGTRFCGSHFLMEIPGKTGENRNRENRSFLTGTARDFSGGTGQKPPRFS